MPIPCDNTSNENAATDYDSCQDVKPDFGITGLAERRGFKGAPLFTANTIRKGSYPAIFSPRTPVSSPSSGFVMTMSNFWASSPKASVPVEDFCVPQHIQDDYYQKNPFDAVTESYFAPHLDNTSFSWSDIEDNFYDFSVYCAITEHKPDFFSTNSLKQTQSGVPTRSTNQFKKQAKTNIYDMPIYDVCAQSSLNGNLKTMLSSNVAHPMSKSSPQTSWFSESAFVNSPNIWLTPPSAPSSPKRQAIKNTPSFIQRAEDALPARSVVPHSSVARRSVRDLTILSDAQRSTALRTPSLRPLILPLHVSKRTTPISSQSTSETEFTDPATTPTPLYLQEPIQLPIIESHSFGSSPIAIELPRPTPAQNSCSPRSSVSASRSVNSSLERRRSRAMVDIISLLDETALGASEVLDAINCEDDSVDVGEISLVGLAGTVVHAV
jgi:hypothetical protein